MRKAAVILYQNPFLLFLLFICLAYLPVLLPFFHIKNDLITQNLPTRFVFSESIYSGFEPFWNPYINYGIPQYGDMNNGFWNPVQWLIGSTIGYSIYSITLEELFYILIGGWGTFKVCRDFFNKEVAIVTGLAYMCSGYITGHMQYLCWLTGVGYFPYVLLYFLRTNKSPVIRNFVMGGISTFFFLASTHPGLIIGAVYFFLFLILIIFINRNDFTKTLYHKKFLLINLTILLTGCLLSLVVIISNLEVLPLISRGSKVTLEETLLHPTTFQSYLSLLFPLAVNKSDWFNTDIGMRNSYIGILSLFGIITAFRYFTKRQLITFSLPLLFFVLLSSGGLFKAFAWKALPLLGYVRLNGEFTYFVILLLLFCGSIGLDKLIKENKTTTNYKTSGNILTGITIAALIVSLTMLLFKGISVQFVPGNGDIKSIIKDIIDKLTIWELLTIQSSIQIATLLIFRKHSSNKIVVTFVFAFNLSLITWLTMPFTGIGMMSKKEVQAVINTFPKGINSQELVSINDTKYIDPSYESQFMLISSYSKKIGYHHQDQYPVQLKKNNDFCSKKTVFEFIKNQAFLFLSADTTINTATNFDSANINVIRSGPGYIKCIIRNNSYKWLTLLQNNYPYWQVKVNGKTVDHFTAFETFISIPVTIGKHEIEFCFEPKRIKFLALLNIGLLAAALLILSSSGFSKRQVFK